MSLPLIALTPADIDALAGGGGGAEVARLLVRGRRSTTLVLIADVLRRDESAMQAWRVLAAVRRRAPAAVERVLDDPAVGAWAVAAVRGAVRPAELAFAAAAAAIRAGVVVEVEVPATDSGFLPSLGWLDGPVAGRWRTDRLRWTAAPVVSLGGVELTITDLPAALLPPLDQSPDVDVGACSALLRSAWRVLTTTDPVAAAEFATLITTLTPTRSRGGQANSSTVTDALGCVFLTFNTDAETLACTLVHELQHAKLAAVMDLHQLTTPGPTRYYAPWREDPRPAAALLHGIYAFLGVTRFWRARRTTSSRAEHEYTRWRSATLSAACTLLSGPDLTPLGRRFVDGIARTLLTWTTEPTHPNAITYAARANTTHRHRWHHTDRPHHTPA